MRKLSATKLIKNIKKGQQKLTFHVGKSIIKIHVTYYQYCTKFYITYPIRWIFFDFNISLFSQQVKMKEIIMHYYWLI